MKCTKHTVASLGKGDEGSENGKFEDPLCSPLASMAWTVYVADVTQCYKSIPLCGNDNLLDALTFILTRGFREAKLLHRKANSRLWIRISSDGTPGAAKWSTIQPKSGCWFDMPLHRLLALHEWLMQNCFVVLGDRVWLQTKGIPMDLSCSPLWYNIYLLSYEVRFIQRLQSLGCIDLMKKFQFSFRYIDAICWLNVRNPYDFVSPTQPRNDNNPFWIYPLHILEIKPEISVYDSVDLTRGISANFMNITIDINTNQPSAYSIRKYDKRHSLPFAYSQFLQFQSNRPVRQSYNVIISQVLPILYISNSVFYAVKEINCLISTFVSNGFQEYRLKRRILDWLIAGSFPQIKFSILDTIVVLSW
jgi:hypothetical protein